VKTDDNQTFDARIRENLRSLPVPSSPAFHFQKPNRPWVPIAAWFSVAAVCVSVAAIAVFSPPRLVSEAWTHVGEEAGLRGNLVHDVSGVNASLGLSEIKPLPGYVQLAKLCQVGGHNAYHVNTFIDGKGWVTILSFQSDVAGAEGQGQWMGRYWAFLPTRSKYTILLLSDDKNALKDVKRYLST
jgi:hypothetical protein